MVVAGGFWPVIVALTPASDRPWISGTADNSIWSLILGYNGLGRLTGQAGGPGGNAMGGLGRVRRRRLRRRDRLAAPARPEHGRPGRLVPRLRARRRASPCSRRRRLRRADARTGWLIAVGGAFLTTAVAFSFAQGIFHPYYVSLLAPFTAALVGAGAAQLAEGGTASPASLAPLAVARRRAAPRSRSSATTPARSPGCRTRCSPPASPRSPRWRSCPQRAIALGAPRRRAADRPRRLVGADARPRHERHVPGRRPADRGHGRARPAGPAAAGGRSPRRAAAAAGGGMFGGDTAALTEALAYTRAHGGGTIAVSSQSGAGTQVIDGAEVAAIGGFSGNESEVTAQLARRRRARRQDPLGPDLRRRPRRHQRRPHRQPLRDGRRRRTPAIRWIRSAGCTTARVRKLPWPRRPPDGPVGTLTIRV